MTAWVKTFGCLDTGGHWLPEAEAPHRRGVICVGAAGPRVDTVDLSRTWLARDRVVPGCLTVRPRQASA